mgnify:CR=1 FL=1
MRALALAFVLLAMPAVGPTTDRLCALVKKYPRTHWSTLADEAGAIRALAVGRRGHRAFHRHAHAQALRGAGKLELLHDAGADQREAGRRG